MHSFPCSALLACFGNTRENAVFDQSSSPDTHSTICVQPVAKTGRHPSHPKVEESTSEKRQDSDTHSERNGSANGSNNKHIAVQPAETFENFPRSLSDEPDCEAVTFQTSIPRPSIIDMPKEQLQHGFWMVLQHLIPEQCLFRKVRNSVQKKKKRSPLSPNERNKGSGFEWEERVIQVTGTVDTVVYYIMGGTLGSTQLEIGIPRGGTVMKVTFAYKIRRWVSSSLS
ncbi:Protein of unknown function DUF1151 containing protein [Cricetulus griseus]|nr:Protein of unknown function DUF1151 containing protein [Cricetulus griseus]